MCQNIYIGSQNELKEKAWNARSPGFYFTELKHKGTLNMLNPILQANYVYEAGSHMGCSCGLTYAPYLKQDDNYLQRIQDVGEFAQFLDKHKKDNKLQLFSTMWDEFPNSYLHKTFSTSEIDSEEFYLKEMVILTVI